jgi:hypothetical protein
VSFGQRALAIRDDPIDRATGRAAAGGPSAQTPGVLPAAASTIVRGAAQRLQVLHPAPIVRLVEGTNSALLARLRKRIVDLLLTLLADVSRSCCSWLRQRRDQLAGSSIPAACTGL